ncbi:MAG TPA: hypothetical protein VN764_03525, partial [Polyangiaceae bacterium]|nr:hypothetical protein [Polyangiaceae bacterium]
VMAGESLTARVLGALSLPVVFYHVIVMGQGRGATVLTIFGISLVMVHSRRATLGVILTLGPLAVASAMGLLDEAVKPFMARVEGQSLNEVDRWHHAEVGDMLVWNMDAEEALTGIWYKKIMIAIGGDSMHNAFYDTLTRFGIPATAPWLVFFLLLSARIMVRMLRPGVDAAETVGRVLALQMIIAAAVAPMFANWRSCVVPGVCAGLLLSARVTRSST